MFRKNSPCRFRKTRPHVEAPLQLFEDEQASTTMDESDEAGDSEYDTSDSEQIGLENTKVPGRKASDLFCRKFKASDASASVISPNFFLAEPVRPNS